MANEYYKSDTLSLYYTMACVFVLACILAQVMFFYCIPPGKDFDSFIALGILVTAIASFVFISLIFSNKGNTVFASVLILIVIASLIWSFLHILPRFAGIA